jgi:hypothetical protein
MKIIHYIANVAILLGSASLLAATFYRVFYISWFNLEPRSFLFFANTCFLLGIALYVRELISKKTE